MLSAPSSTAPAALQALHQHRVLRGRRVVAVDLGAGQRGQALHIKQVFHGVGHTGQRAQRLAARAACIHCRRFRTGALEGAGGEGVDPRVGGFDARDSGFHLVDGARAHARPVRVLRGKRRRPVDLRQLVVRLQRHGHQAADHAEGTAQVHGDGPARASSIGSRMAAAADRT
jgi:hypothetical protein